MWRAASLSGRATNARCIAVVLTGVLVLAPALALAGCSEDGGEPAPTTAPTTSTVPDPITVNVEPDGSGDYPDLASAAAGVPPGSTIILGAGKHHLDATLQIRGDLTLLGAGGTDTTVVSATGPVLRHGGGTLTSSGITFAYEGTSPANVVEVSGSILRFSDLAFTGGVAGGDGSPAGHGLLAAGVTTGRITGTAAADNGGDGFHFTDSSRVALTRTRAMRNGGSGFSWTGNARSDGRVVRAVGNLGTGVSVSADAGVILSESHAAGNGGDGIAATDRSHFSCYDCTIRANAKSGLTAAGESRVAINGSVSTGNRGSGFLFAGDASVSVTNTVAAWNDGSGFSILDRTSSLLRANTARGNGGAGFHTTGEASVDLIANTSVANTTSGFELHSARTPGEGATAGQG